MASNDLTEPMRRRPDANPPSYHVHQTPSIRTSLPLCAPMLMLDNGMGEVSKLPSPIVGKMSDDDSVSDIATPVQEHVNPHSLVALPDPFDHPEKSPRTRAYSPSTIHIKPPPPSPKRSLSPPKMIASSTDGKPRPVCLR